MKAESMGVLAYMRMGYSVRAEFKTRNSYNVFPDNEDAWDFFEVEVPHADMVKLVNYSDKVRERRLSEPRLVTFSAYAEGIYCHGDTKV